MPPFPIPSSMAPGKAFSIPSLTPYSTVPVPPKVKTPVACSGEYPTRSATSEATATSTWASP